MLQQSVYSKRLQQSVYSKAFTGFTNLRNRASLLMCVCFLTFLSVFTVAKCADCEGSAVPCEAWSDEYICDFVVPLPPGSLPPGAEPCLIRAIYKMRRCGDEVEIQIFRYEYIGDSRPECRTAFNNQMTNNGQVWQKQVWYHSNRAIMIKEFMNFYTQLPQNMRTMFDCPNGVKRFYVFQARCMKFCVYNDQQNQVMVLVPKNCYGGKCCKMVSELCFNTATQSVQSTDTFIEISGGTPCIEDPSDSACPSTFGRPSTTGGSQTLNLDATINLPCFTNCD